MARGTWVSSLSLPPDKPTPADTHDTQSPMRPEGAHLSRRADVRRRSTRGASDLLREFLQNKNSPTGQRQSRADGRESDERTEREDNVRRTRRHHTLSPGCPCPHTPKGPSVHATRGDGGRGPERAQALCRPRERALRAAFSRAARGGRGSLSGLLDEADALVDLLLQVGQQLVEPSLPPPGGWGGVRRTEGRGGGGRGKPLLHTAVLGPRAGLPLASPRGGKAAVRACS